MGTMGTGLHLLSPNFPSHQPFMTGRPSALFLYRGDMNFPGGGFG
jgi:hypothetical protein